MLLTCLLLLLITACGNSPPPANGWAIVAADPKTGNVGVAGASCNQYPYDHRAALVPDLGVAAQLGIDDPLYRDRIRAWIQGPTEAPKVVRFITSKNNDAQASRRQYGVLTMQGGTLQGAAYTGTATASFAGDQIDTNAGVIVLGSGVVNENVLRHSMDTFRAEPTAPLADKLMRALEAGSAVGGIALCNSSGVAQTASTAFVMMARGGDPMFEVETLGNTAPQEPNPPYLALSATEPIGGKNAVSVLRDQYNQWRPAALGECAECLESRVTLPEGGDISPAPEAALADNAMLLVIGFILLVMGLTIVYFRLRPRMGQSSSGSV